MSIDFSNLEYVIPCLFGLEGLVRDEINRMGIEVKEVTDGRVVAAGGLDTLAKLNLNLRTGERVLIRLAHFHAETFEDLFQGAKAVEWGDIIGKDDVFPVSGHAIKSRLFSVPDCQKIIKKAMVEKLKEKYKISWFPESGVKYPVSFLIINNEASILLDTSGDGLHKRGYRADANEAPIKETLAAAIVLISRYRGRDVLVDPMCGSGTLSIEAAMIAAEIAPGLRRSFAFEKYAFFNKALLEKERGEALSKIRPDTYRILASDIDPKMAELTRHNAGLAGVSKHIQVSCADVAAFQSDERYGTILCNPPYGERMLDKKDAFALYQAMGKVFLPHKEWAFYVITSDEEFEKNFGRKADKKRKLYNGMIKCDLYQYLKLRVEKS